MLRICKVLCFYYLFYLCCDAVATSKGNTQALLTPIESALALRNVSAKLFYELEELSRIVDISYCVGTTGILKPFLCASRCQEFPDFELVTVGVILIRRSMLHFTDGVLDLEYWALASRLVWLHRYRSFPIISTHYCCL